MMLPTQSNCTFLLLGVSLLSAVSTAYTSLANGKLSCWNHHCDYGKTQLLCYRPLFTCDIAAGDNPLETSLRCIKSENVSEGYSPKPDLYCSSDFISDCTCAHRKTGADGDLEPSDRTEHAYCKCGMNFRAKSVIIILVVICILIVCVVVGVVFGYVKLLEIKHSLKIRARMVLESQSSVIKSPASVKDTGNQDAGSTGSSQGVETTGL